MSEFTIVREFCLVVDGVRKAIGDKINPVLWAIGAGVIIVVAIAGGGFLLLRDIGVVDKRVERLQAEVQAVREQANTISAALAEISNGQRSIQAVLNRIEDRVGPARTGLDLTENQRRTILSFFNLRPGIAGPPKWKIGDLVPEGLIKQIPEELLKLVPSLKGTKCAFDLNGYIVITDAFQNRVIALVPLG